jgi:GNAT superfamily N-acetyltransferase
MVCIESLSSSSSPTVLVSARTLFLAYGDFLRASGEHDGFSFDLLQREALDLPAVYAATNGAVLVAVVEGFSIGCIAFREFPGSVEQDRCEIKRLFVLPEYRGCGIGLRLATAALELAHLKGYRFAYLDTEPIVMAAAHRMYLELGFVEYDSRGAGIASVFFLRKSLS